ncbi:hypothetical protein [Burkholderia multivorans]|uniref:hypothetical protein n=1 Tax=Burkholderia multivorans TaxID=87883 RepID=UPI0028585EF9|nr:hypothetical protein [Burkholderia multivorans]MDR9166736.1 Mercuric resistance operon regulatory protein [Burkholderia multivorans]
MALVLIGVAHELATKNAMDVFEKLADFTRIEQPPSQDLSACHADEGHVTCSLIASLQRTKWRLCRKPGQPLLPF